MRSYKQLWIFLIILMTSFFQNGYAQFSQEEEEMLQLVNDIRNQNGLEPLQLNPYLNEAAYAHSLDMGENNYFSHTGLNGSSFSQRVYNTDYEGAPTSENIAAGNSSSQATFNQWVNSSGHLNNILNPNINEMGIGHAIVNGSDYTHYWTQIFGKGDNTLSINEHSLSKISKVYPNPVKNTLHLSLRSGAQETTTVKIITINGQIVDQKNVNSINDIHIPVNHLPTGIYFLTINNRKQPHKIVKI